MRGLLFRGEFAIGNPCVSHAFDNLMVKAPGHQEAEPNRNPPYSFGYQPGESASYSGPSDRSPERRLFSLFHVLSSVDANVGSLAHELA